MISCGAAAPRSTRSAPALTAASAPVTLLTATRSAGARSLDVYQALSEHAVAIPGGSCASVGIAGLTQGGGHGLMSRKFGLTCDNNLGVEMVLADGSVVRANAKENCLGPGQVPVFRTRSVRQSSSVSSSLSPRPS